MDNDELKNLQLPPLSDILEASGTNVEGESGLRNLAQQWMGLTENEKQAIREMNSPCRKYEEHVCPILERECGDGRIRTIPYELKLDNKNFKGVMRGFKVVCEYIKYDGKNCDLMRSRVTPHCPYAQNETIGRRL